MGGPGHSEFLQNEFLEEFGYDHEDALDFEDSNEFLFAQNELEEGELVNEEIQFITHLRGLVT